eukprot:gene13060-biopygen12073
MGGAGVRGTAATRRERLRLAKQWRQCLRHKADVRSTALAACPLRGRRRPHSMPLDLVWDVRK